MAVPGPSHEVPGRGHALSWPGRGHTMDCHASAMHCHGRAVTRLRCASPCLALPWRAGAMPWCAWPGPGTAMAVPSPCRVVLCQCSALPWPSGGQAISAWPMPCNAMTVSGHAVFRHASAVHCHGWAAATPKVPCLWVGIIWAPLGACRWTCVQSAVGRAEAPLGPPGSERGYK